MTVPRRVAVVGAGWAGLAAAVEATTLGHAVTLLDMAPLPGGRARSSPDAQGRLLDNGQHILIGAYRDTLALMARVGVDPADVLHRQPLSLRDTAGHGLQLPAGRPLPAFVRGVLGWRELRLRDRLRLLVLATRWRLAGFRCDPRLSVAELARGCPEAVYRQLLDPLCVAALNTPADQASAQVLLTVLRDALFSGPGAADLLLPRVPLDDLLPQPALRWLQGRGAAWRPRQRVQALAPGAEGGWRLDGEPFDQVILACSAAEAARLLAPLAPAWSAEAQGFAYQPIVTVWLQVAGVRWPQPMLRFDGGPAQFGFDLGALGGPADTCALVVSGAAEWTARGLEASTDAILAQWQAAFPHGPTPSVLAVRAEKRATFACVPGLSRPTAAPLPGLRVAGDYVAGPYPATLEGAVRSGLGAARGLA